MSDLPPKPNTLSGIRRPSCAFLLAALCFSLYFLLPYSHLFAPALSAPPALVLLVTLAVAWIACVGGHALVPRENSPERVRLGGRDALVLLLFLAAFAALQWPYLTLPFAYCGDEDHHLQGARLLEKALASGASREATAESLSEWLRRYPPALIAFETLLANRWLGTYGAEWAHRLAAFLPMALFAAWPYVALRRRGVPLPEALPALACLALVPVVFYHAAVLYIEPLLLLVEGAVLLSIASRDTFETRDLFQIALLASCAGLVKEIAPPFLAAIALWFAWRVLVRGDGPVRARCLTFARLAGTLILPCVPFMAVRAIAGKRDYPFAVGNLIRPEFYARWSEAAWGELTIGLLVLAATGFVFMAWRRRLTDLLIVALLLLAGYGALFSFDHLKYVGYGRFVLNLVPALSAGVVGLCLAPRDICPIGRWSLPGRALLFAAVIAGIGAVFVPWRVEDRESWGCPGEKTGEYCYAFDRAVGAAAAQLPADTGLFVYISGGEHYYNALPFYLARSGLTGRLSGMTFGEPLSPAAAATLGKTGRPFRLMLLCHHAPSPPEPESVPGVRFVERFTLGRRAVDLYEVAQ